MISLVTVTDSLLTMSFNIRHVGILLWYIIEIDSEVIEGKLSVNGLVVVGCRCGINKYFTLTNKQPIRC